MFLKVLIECNCKRSSTEQYLMFLGKILCDCNKDVVSKATISRLGEAYLKVKGPKCLAGLIRAAIVMLA